MSCSCSGCLGYIDGGWRGDCRVVIPLGFQGCNGAAWIEVEELLAKQLATKIAQIDHLF